MRVLNKINDEDAFLIEGKTFFIFFYYQQDKNLYIFMICKQKQIRTITKIYSRNHL